MREDSELVKFEQQFPDRHFDVGIAEQHAVTSADGLACEDMKPVVAIYSAFLQHAYDQLVHDITLQNLPVLFAVDRADIVGTDGPTHAGLYDLSSLRCVPNMIVTVPSDENKCRLLLSACYQADAPVAVHYLHGTGTGAPVSGNLETVATGKSIIRCQDEETVFIAFGNMVAPALAVTGKLNATVADIHFVKPMDERLIVHLARDHDYIVTAEENTEQGGAGSTVLEVLVKHGICKPVLLLGATDAVTEHGDPKELLDDLGLSVKQIEQRIQQWMAAKTV